MPPVSPTGDHWPFRRFLPVIPGRGASAGRGARLGRRVLGTPARSRLAPERAKIASFINGAAGSARAPPPLPPRAVRRRHQRPIGSLSFRCFTDRSNQDPHYLLGLHTARNLAGMFSKVIEWWIQEGYFVVPRDTDGTSHREYQNGIFVISSKHEDEKEADKEQDITMLIDSPDNLSKKSL